MKKLLYSSIILGAAVFAFGIQGNNVLTVKAEDVVSTESVNEPASEKVEPKENIESDKKVEEQGVNSDNTNALGEEKPDDPSKTGTAEESSGIDVNTIPVLAPKTGNRINVSDGSNPLIYIKPREDKIAGLSNTEDPANKGDLMVPYTYHGNAAIFEIEDGKIVLDDRSETGYKEREFDDVYVNDPDIRSNSGKFTEDIYGVSSGNQATKKEKLIEALKQEAFFFMERRNHGYSNEAELNSYKDAFNKKLGEIQALNDDGTPVVKTPVTGTTTVSHSHHTSTRTQSNVQDNETLPLVVVAIRQAKLYTTDGRAVTDRGLSDSSVWMVDKVATINGQKMYRISADEWVAANDVI